MTEHDSKKEHDSEKKEHGATRKVHEAAGKKDSKAYCSIKKSTLWKSATAVFAVLLVASVFTGGFGLSGNLNKMCLGICVEFDKDGSGKETGGTNNEVIVAPPEQPPQQLPPERINVDLGTSPVKGESDAPVTMVEFSDFECPFCGRFFSDTLPQIESEYIKTGKVRFVYKHLPLDFHAQAVPAALASECAHEQGRFWEYHDLLLGNQESLSDANYKKWAGDLSLKQPQFDECLESRKHQDRVSGDAQQAAQAGISGTPGFLINGITVSGAQPFEAFQQVIEGELAG